jgi:hypothetical protein
MKKIIWLLIGSFAFAGQLLAKEYTLSFPNGNNWEIYKMAFHNSINVVIPITIVSS